MSRPLTPSYTGFIGSTKDAMLVIQEVLTGNLPAVSHRPHDHERPTLIRSGHVFVFIEELSGIKRWTDGVSWLPLRILGRFLVYRELDPATLKDKHKKCWRRKHLLASVENSKYGYACDGPAVGDNILIKKTLSVTAGTGANKQTIHLILYFCAHDVLAGKLTRPLHGTLANVVVPSLLWDAVESLLFSGKMPIEDEALYFLDASYQLQNMSVLLATYQVPYGLAKVLDVLPSPQTSYSGYVFNNKKENDETPLYRLFHNMCFKEQQHLSELPHVCYDDVQSPFCLDHHDHPGMCVPVGQSSWVAYPVYNNTLFGVEQAPVRSMLSQTELSTQPHLQQVQAQQQQLSLGDIPVFLPSPMHLNRYDHDFVHLDELHRYD